MTAAVLDRPVWRLADDPRPPELRVADRRLAGAEAALAGGDLGLARRLVRQAIADLADVVPA